MELKDFIQVLSKGWKLVIISLVVCVAATTVVTFLLPVKYRAIADVYVKRQKESESENYYTYDGYYSTQASVQYTDTVSGFFQSIQVIRDVAGKIQMDADYVRDENDPKDLAADVEYLEGVMDKIKVQDIAPQVISIEYVDKEERRAKMWLDYLGDEVQNKVEQLNKSGDDKFEVEVLGEPMVKEMRPNLILNLVVSSMSGILLGFVWAFVRHYYQTSEGI